jgi:hypothetical protein
LSGQTILKGTGKKMVRRLSARLLATVFAALLIAPAFSEIIDRVVAVVGNDAITESQVKRQLALQALIDGRLPAENANPNERRQAINRLIERQLVRREMAVANFPAEGETQVAPEIEQLRAQRFWNGLDFTAALRAYRIEESDVHDFLREKNSVLDFIDFRFKTGLQISNEEIENYYRRVYLPEFQRANSSSPPALESVSGQIEDILREREIEPKVNEWLNELRLRSRVAIFAESAQPPMDAGE